ncbi:MAG: sigma-70 family RNA polymerase sigma factor [Ruminococcaceae bacterium]|nr:sigma-70 family RNA polymerase sigma factor [Oscillospiraceae bacterium]
MPMEDHKIIELFFARSEEAIAHVREKYGPMCRKIAANMLNDAEDADECVNDTLLALWNAIPPARPQLLRPYIARISRNQARNRLVYNKAQKRSAEMAISLEELDGCLASPDSVEQAMEGRDLTRAIERFLLTLDEDSRNMFLRRYWFYDSVEEIAEGFGVSKNKVKVRLFRAREKLRAYLLQEGYLYETGNIRSGI